MSHVTLAQLKAHDAEGASARERFLRWMIGHHSVETAVFEFAVEEFRAAPTAKKARTLFALAEQGHGKTIPPVLVAPLTLAEPAAWVAIHHRDDDGASPVPAGSLFDAAQHDQEVGLFPGLLGVYDDDYDRNEPDLVATVEEHVEDLRALAATLREAGFNPGHMGFAPPYE